jgi:hypothetical protein
MHISNARIQEVFELHMHRVRPVQTWASEAVQTADKLTLSGKANEIQAIKSYVAAMPDVRSDKVHHLQGMIRKDRYQPTDADIASAILANSASPGMIS